MNRVLYILLTALIACPAVQALDIKTDASCKKLIIAIKNTQSIDACKTAWHNITQSPNITAEDQQDTLNQALQLAREQKTAIEQELTNLGDQTKNQSKIKWGVGQLALGTYLASSFLLFYASLFYKLKTDTILSAEHPSLEKIERPLIPSLWLRDNGLELLATLTAILHLSVINHIGMPYCFYKGYHNLKQGLNYKQYLQDKITNLDAIISYLQDLQTNNQ